MLRYISVQQDLQSEPLETVSVAPDAIHPTLESALGDPHAASVLVYEASSIPENGSDPLKLTISEAKNGRPYLPPVVVHAAGGYVVRDTSSGLDVLLIFRRGVWDLPKGKVDEGETIEATALREVREEVGAEDLRILATLHTTVHGYPHDRRYAVKTTHWFLMHTSSEHFTPQRVEGIEEVRWVEWHRAPEMLGFQTLRDHMASVPLQEVVRNSLTSR